MQDYIYSAFVLWARIQEKMFEVPTDPTSKLIAIKVGGTWMWINH